MDRDETDADGLTDDVIITSSTYSCLPLKNRPAHRPDSVRSWIVCAAGVFSSVISVGTTYSFGLLYPSLLAHFKQGKVVTAWVGSLACANACFLGLLAALLLSRLDPRLVIVIGALCCSLGLFLTSQVSALWMMFLSYSLLFAFGASCVYATVFSVVPKYFIKTRALATSLIAVGPGAGMFIMSQVTDISLNSIGWRGALMVLASLHMLLCVSAVLFDPHIERVEMKKGKCGGVWLKYQERSRSNVWTNRVFMAVSIAILVNLIGLSIPQLHMARYCEDLGMELSRASRLYMAFGILSMLFRVVSGRLSDTIWMNPRYLGQIVFSVPGMGYTPELLISCFWRLYARKRTQKLLAPVSSLCQLASLGVHLLGGLSRTVSDRIYQHSMWQEASTF
ncbi:monocarboxylate transporter 13 isoform X2 [Nematostella vectensis]|uniref:monocarboxylate transporter 13 isoform X2 n=1 Tax=Nematostella vectensis TaxID=45351 RepID=UPI0020772BB8|nr:monocarboxylate transporter 13 isoform X2 [Nematostella vectensis]